MVWGERSERRERKIRYGVVGLGRIAQAAVLPAFKNARSNSELVALVSDDIEKLATLSKRHGVPHTFAYDRIDELFGSGLIDAVYIALPNSMHREYTERAARRGLHVLCEKPMAVTETDCAAMIRVCEDHHVKLMVAYRLHFDLCHLEAVEIVQSGKLGDPRIFHSVFTQQVAPGNTRLRARFGEDAAVADMGIYCINAARYLFQDEPTEVCATVATGADPRFLDVGEMTSVVMRFPGERLASFTCSFGAAPSSMLEVAGTEGRIRIEPAYDFELPLRHELTIGDKTHVQKFSKRDQFGPEIAYFSDCVIRDLMPEPSGWEGLADVRIIEAVHRAIATRQTVKISPIPRRRRPSISQIRLERPFGAPDLVHAASTSGR